ncbi:PAS domain-containing protein [Dongia rigui]|uniref:PAS domain-containing protein n=1 Tax=Dongia rigui TaxID=940149 RepID=A0ABU5DUI2_9PROT|nr:PAS domain-containing protein [Dongia rigui]MDY0870868.1 PAS domain-containing protein [Dongia rigui]
MSRSPRVDGQVVAREAAPAQVVPAHSYHNDILAFHAFWQRKCRGRVMPARQDFDPGEMVTFLPGIVLIDVVADARRFVYRLLGTREVAMRNADPTGKGVAEGFYAASAEAALASYEDVLTRRAPRFEQRRFLTPDNRIGHEQTVILPLSDDGQTINKIIAYTHHHLI